MIYDPTARENNMRKMWLAKSGVVNEHLLAHSLIYKTNLGKSNGPITQDWLQKKRAWSKKRTSIRNSCDDVWGIKVPTYRMLLRLLLQWIVRAVHQQSTNCFRKSMTTLTSKTGRIQRQRFNDSKKRFNWRKGESLDLTVVGGTPAILFWMQFYFQICCAACKMMWMYSQVWSTCALVFWFYQNFQRLMERFGPKITWVNFNFNSSFFTFTSPTPPGHRPKVSKGGLLV